MFSLSFIFSPLPQCFFLPGALVLFFFSSFLFFFSFLLFSSFLSFFFFFSSFFFFFFFLFFFFFFFSPFFFSSLPLLLLPPPFFFFFFFLCPPPPPPRRECAQQVTAQVPVLRVVGTAPGPQSLGTQHGTVWAGPESEDGTLAISEALLQLGIRPVPQLQDPQLLLPPSPQSDTLTPSGFQWQQGRPCWLLDTDREPLYVVFHRARLGWCERHAQQLGAVEQFHQQVLHMFTEEIELVRCFPDMYSGGLVMCYAAKREDLEFASRARAARRHHMLADLARNMHLSVLTQDEYILRCLRALAAAAAHRAAPGALQILFCDGVPRILDPMPLGPGLALSSLQVFFCFVLFVC